MMTITEKILAAHCGRKEVKPGELINAKLDLVLANDITAPIAIKEFRAAGAKMTHCLCVFDYASDRLNQHEGRDNLAKNDIRLHVLANWDDVLDTGLSKATSLKTPASRLLIFSRIPRIGAARWASCKRSPRSKFRIQSVVSSRFQGWSQATKDYSRLSLSPTSHSCIFSTPVDA